MEIITNIDLLLIENWDLVFVQKIGTDLKTPNIINDVDFILIPPHELMN
ncbi:MAG: hypothetical protein GY739_15405 [Mesoflavibacter sp.]|nr:hypothetical protein [Mesoflavibacter sp.]